MKLTGVGLRYLIRALPEYFDPIILLLSTLMLLSAKILS